MPILEIQNRCVLRVNENAYDRRYENLESEKKIPMSLAFNLVDAVYLRKVLRGKSALFSEN